MNTTLPDSRLITIPYHQDPLSTIAELIVQRFADSLPNLSQITILLSTPHAATALRRDLITVLTQHGTTAVLGPHISTLTNWVEHQVLPASDTITQVISDQARELLLVEALKEYPAIYKDSNPWQLAASLIPLFDDLTRYHVSIAENIDVFIAQLGEAYGLKDHSNNALSMEATLVHQLWQAMQQDLSRLQAVDNATAYLLRLKQSLQHIQPTQHFILAGQFDFIPAEMDWISSLLKKNQLTLITQSEQAGNASAQSVHPVLCTTPPWMEKLAHDTQLEFQHSGESIATSHFFQQVFDVDSSSLLKRSTQFVTHQPSSPLHHKLKCFAAANAEEEAMAIDVRLRQWLLEGRKRIALVTDNRRLARRVRALLERADVILQDSSGWALSTTSAATVIERWLECIEQDFHYHAFLDFLKSPFVGSKIVEFETAGPASVATDEAGKNIDTEIDARSDFLSIVDRFEQGVVIHENIASNLQRYRTHTEYRIKRVADNMRAYYTGVLPMLDTIESAAKPLQTLFKQQTSEPLAYLDALEEGLHQLGVWQALAADAAGNLIIHLLRQMRRSCQYTRFPMSWIDFRVWLGQTLERSNFIPDHKHYHVQLLSLAQTDLQGFDGLVIAAAEYDFLPGAASPSPFFNDAVRMTLGIPVRQQGNAHSYRIFRRLLESCHSTHTTDTGTILFTRRHSENGEEILASPWLEALQSFHQLAYTDDLTDHVLGELVQLAGSAVQRDKRPLPVPVKANPATSAPPDLIPKTISATAYQQLIDCPYQFFAARCLQLSPPDTVRELLEKDDYGNRVHRCLEAFHTDIPGIDGPFSQTLNATTREAAIATLENISRQIFSRDIENNFLHRGWLKQWLSVVPGYIDWQIKRNVEWQVTASERHYTDLALDDSLYITGILDRIDERDGQRAIIDYKTGYVPAQDAIDSGEAVQLPFYAMLANTADGLSDTVNKPVQRVEYLSLSTDTSKFGNRVQLEGEQLDDINQQNQSRLIDVVTALRHGTEMPAWGDDKVCQYCRFDSLCRRQLWDTSPVTNEALSGI